MMRYKHLILTVVIAVMSSSSVANAQSVSDMLEKGIFTEETVGDLDAAIKIYEKIIAQDAKNRSYAAQAQYRMGMCYLKKGQDQEAAAAFRKLIDQFPQQTDPIAQAKVQLAALGHPVSTISGGARYRLVLDDALANLLGASGAANYDFSPDGDKIVFLAPWELEQVNSTAKGKGARNGTGWVGLYVSDRSGSVIRPLMDIERYIEWMGNPRWSPDGRLIAFCAHVPQPNAETSDTVPALFVVEPDGGAPRQIGPAPLPGEGARTDLSWTPDSRHLTYTREDGFYTMDLDGKIVRFIERKNSRSIKLGGYSPDGRWLVFGDANEDRGRDVWLVRASGGDAVRVTDGTVRAGQPAWAHDGRAIYFVSKQTQGNQDSNVWRLELDPQSGAAVGKIEQVTFYTGARIRHPKALPGGNALAFGLSKTNSVINVAEASRPETARAVARGEPACLSPDGQTLYYIHGVSGQTGIFAQNMQGGPPRRVTPTRLAIGRLNLSPDGRTIAYGEHTGGKVDYFTVSVQGGEPRLLASSPGPFGRTPRWSPDGEKLAYALDDSLYVIPASGGQAPTRIAQMAVIWESWSVRWSPDGEYVAAFGYFESTKENAVYIVPASGGEPRRLTPPDGIQKEGLEWHPDGERLTYCISTSHSKTYQAFLDGRPPSLLLDHADSWDYIGRWTADGSQYYFSGSAGGEWKVFVYDTESGDVQLFWEHSSLPVWSRDGKTMAWSSSTNTNQLWLIEDFLSEPKVSATPGPVTRQVWAPALDTMGTPSPDGRYLSYVNWTQGNLAMHDLETGENRDLTDEGTWETPSEFCDASLWSPDSRRVAYVWIGRGKNGSSLRIVGLDGSKPRILASSKSVGAYGVPWPRAWSQDGKYILAISYDKNESLTRGEEGHIALISVADGSVRVLNSLGERHCPNASLSPDGRYVVFELDPKPGSRKGDIHLLATDGSGEIALVEHPADDNAPFWAPDGKRIVFFSDRSGSMGLWMLDVNNGKPKGTPTLVKEMGDKSAPMGFTRDGSFYYSVRTPTNDVYVATLDFEAGKVLAPPTKRSLRFEGSNYAPFWSPDGKFLAYASRRSSGTALVIRSAETGEERDLSPQSLPMRHAHHNAAPRWSPDGRSILVAGQAKGVSVLHLIDVQTGEFTTIALNEPKKEGGGRSAAFWPVFSNDGKQIYYVRDRSIVAHDLETGRGRELYRTNGYIHRLACSPDGRRLAFLEAAAALRPTVVKTIPALGGEPRELYTLKEGKRFSWGVGLAWTPDGRHVIVGGPDGPDKPDELWSIPVAGGEPRKLNLGVKVDHLSLHPDGRRIAFTGPEPNGGEEVWVMENFLPEPIASE